MKTILLCALAVLFESYGFAQNFLTITATHIQDASGNPLASGQLCVQGVALNGQPLPFRAGGGGMVHTQPTCAAILNGVLNNLSIANSANTFPANIAYVITVTDNTTGQTLLNVGPTQISCSAAPLAAPCNGVTGSGIWNFDLFETNTPTLALIQTGPQGPKGDTGVSTANGTSGGFLVPGNLVVGGGDPWIDVMSAAYGALISGTDDTTAIQSALTAASGTAQTVYVPCLSNGIANISATLTIPSGVHFVTCTGGQNQSGTNRSGVTLKWVGATNTPIIKVWNANHSSVEGFILDCNSVSGCIGVQYASNNSPASSYFDLLHVLVRNAHQGLVIGDPSNTAANCASTPNGLGCAQADSATVYDFNVAGSGSDSSAEAIHVNDTNGVQSSKIRMGNYQNVQYGVHMIASNGNLTIEAINGANALGAKTFILLESTVAAPPNLMGNETEGNWTYAVHDSASNASYQYASLWSYNAFNNPILCDGTDHILSLANNGGNHTTIPWTAGGTCVVDSLLDNTENSTTMTAWVSSGSGSLNALGSINGVGGASVQGPLNVTYNGSTVSTTKGNISLASSATAGALFIGGDGGCFVSRSGSTLALNCGNGATISMPGTGTTLTVPVINASGNINAGSYSAGATAGLSVTKNLTGSTGSSCTETFTAGLLTASTCP